MKAAVVLAFALMGCASAPERIARSLELSAWTYDAESSDTGLASRVTTQGVVGSQGLLEASGAGEGYGFGVTMSLDRLLGPEVQPMRWEGPPPGWEPEFATAPRIAPEEKRAANLAAPKRIPPWVIWLVTMGAPALIGVLEAVSRLRGHGGVIGPAARKLADKLA